MTTTLETIHNAHQLALVSGAIAPALQQMMSVVAEQDGTRNPDTATLLEQIQNAMAAAESGMNGMPVDASPDELAQTYADLRRPPAPTPATAGGQSFPEQVARQLDQIAYLHRNGVIAIVDGANPAQMPAHFRNALWMALACQDAIRRASAAARKSSYSGLIIAGT